tara:strand:+ start:286 stop:645 length:360 start_codon:yes stop_codon:yes gene_type:complete
MTFQTPLVIEDLNDGKTFKLHAPLVYKSLDGKVITVPSGFVTDLASIPGWVRSVSKLGRWNRPAVIHDYYYSMLGNKPAREWVDKLFLEMMESADVGWRRHIIYRAVRAAGWRYYDKPI